MALDDSSRSVAPTKRPSLSYGDYLGLDQVLGAQHPRSDQPDEMLFIIIHQASELWMKLVIHELVAARDRIAVDDLSSALKMIARVGRIQSQMIQSWDVLETLTPSEYARIRPSLGQSSEFQSYQYRQIDFILGLNNPSVLKAHEPTPGPYAELLGLFNSPSLYDEALRPSEDRRAYHRKPDGHRRQFGYELSNAGPGGVIFPRAAEGPHQPLGAPVRG